MHIEYDHGKNFGIIVDQKYDYVDGTVVVRGGNGSGKTTFVAQLPMYVMFGSSTLDAPLADTANDNGKLEGELKYGPYVAKRSKASASVVGNGVQISGQEDVSNFFYQLFGITKGTEEAVLLAKQGNTAGILSEKPGKVSAVIEELAGFDQIDQLMERVKEKFPTGAKAVLEAELEKLAERKTELDNEELPIIPDLKARLSDATFAVEVHTEPRAAAKKLLDGIRTRLQKSTTTNNKIGLAELSLKNKADELVKYKVESEELRGIEFRVFPEPFLKRARELTENVADMLAARSAYEWVEALVPPTEHWAGDFAGFEAELLKMRGVVNTLENDYNDLSNKIVSKNQEKQKGDTCTVCGSDISTKNAEINARVESELGGMFVQRSKLLADLDEERPYLNQLEDLMDIHKSFRTGRPQHELVVIDEDFVPYKYSWSGDEPPVPDQAAINDANELLRDHELEQTKIELHRKQVSKLKEEVILSKEQLDDLDKVLAGLGKRIDTTVDEKDVTRLESQIEDLEKQISECKLKMSTAETALAVGEEKVATNSKLLQQNAADETSAKEKLRIDGRNGKLVKSIRDAKPKVLDLVWGNVLKAVSQTHSEMLGREMSIVKDTKGFKINGRAVARLSGAEKSTLGIALRSAIRDVFAPGCNFMFLDEPFSDMDPDVKYNAMAAVTALRGQRFIITHEGESELLADQVMEMSR